MTNAHLVVNGVLPTDAADDAFAHVVCARETAAFDAVRDDLAALPRTTLPLLVFNTVGVPALGALLDPASAPKPLHGTEAASLSAGVTGLCHLVDEIEAGGHGSSCAWARAVSARRRWLPRSPSSS
ncbi:MAG: hypothetical protein L0H96_21980 [Humibacillus sp.]|nr:hypothetical protein [Humibacillus sp.]MDN5779566.1 hypothetical protein [Humibacillus sp.]